MYHMFTGEGMRTTLFAAGAVMSGIIIGFLLGASMAQRVPLGAEASVEWHWKRVNEYRAFMRDPQNLHSTPHAGLNALTPPYDIVPSLIALESAGEIEHVDLILPNVPYSGETTLHWFRFCDAHKEDILQAMGNTSGTSIKLSGIQPLRLNIWYRKSAKIDIQKLIDDLELLASEQRVDDLQLPLNQ
jgi:hypothetical protein